MAILEVVKALTNWQEHFNRRAVLRWLVPEVAPKREWPYLLSLIPRLFFDIPRFKQKIDAYASEKFIGEKVERFEDSPLWKDFLHLACGLDEREQTGMSDQPLFDQPVAKMMGQIQAAVTVTLDFPDWYPAFYHFLVNDEGSQTQRKNAAHEANGVAISQVSTRQPLQNGALEAANARARVQNFVQRRLDMLQNDISYAWARVNQAAAVLISEALIFSFIIGSTQLSFKQGIAIFFVAIPLGAIAPFAKDLVSALSSFGK
jgi:hypothetical protein